MTAGISGNPFLAFFAYPASPPALAETIRSAIAEINRGGAVEVTGWESLRVGGKLLVDALCRAINDRPLFLADLTHLNPNVLFELGYAIASKKRIWLVLDDGLPAAKRDFQDLRSLTTLAYRSYQNSQQITDAFYRDSPHQSLEPSFFDLHLQPNLAAAEHASLLYLKSLHDTQSSVRISRRLEKSGLPLIYSDPQEGGPQPLLWYVQRVYESLGVVASLCDPERDGARPTNALYALVAGLAHGFGKPVLLLVPGPRLSPLDYRDLAKEYLTAAEADTALASWLVPVTDTYDHSTRRSFGAIRLATELRQLRLGEHIAENEADELADYFVDTAPYQDALKKRQLVLVGRKGVGKSAILLHASDELRADKRNLVVVVKPVAYDLEGVLRLLNAYTARDARGYLMESVWKYILYSEIAQAIFREIDDRVVRGTGASPDETAFLRLFTADDSPLGGDFSTRLERAVGAVMALPKATSVETERSSISEALHQGILSALRRQLGGLLANRERVAILVDNLDKAWDREADIPLLSEFLLGLLSASQRIISDFQKADVRRQSVNLSLVVFLRSDIFSAIRQKAREPDKIAYARLIWSDEEMLLRIIEERFRANRPAATTDELWEAYFTPRVGGVPTKKYIIQSLLPRPRDLIFFVNAAIATAVNRGHTAVSEDDIAEAQKHYSKYALDTLRVENANYQRDLGDVFFEFAGAQSILTEAEVFKLLKAAKVPDEEFALVISHLTSESFLGLEIEAGEFEYAVDDDDLRLKLVRARKYLEASNKPRRYAVHTAFREFLEIAEPF